MKKLLLFLLFILLSIKLYACETEAKRDNSGMFWNIKICNECFIAESSDWDGSPKNLQKIECNKKGN